MKGKLTEPTPASENGSEGTPLGLDLKGRDRCPMGTERNRGFFVFYGLCVTYAIALSIANSTFIFSSPFMFTFHLCFSIDELLCL